MLEGFFVGFGVEGEVDGAVGPGGVEGGVGEFDGVDAFLAGDEEGSSFEDGVDEVFHDGGVLGGGVFDGDFDVPEFGAGEACFGGFAEGAHGNFVACEGEFAGFEDEFAAVAGDFEAVCAGGFAGGGDEEAGGTGWIFHEDGDVVFDFDVVEAAELAEAADARWFAEEPVEEIDLVRALVEERAAAFAFPGRAPAAAGVVGFGAEPIGDDPIDADDLAEFAAVDELFDFLVTGLGAELEHGAENFFGFFGGVNEAFAIGFVNGDGFLDHGVEAALEGENAEGGVGIVGGADEDGIDGAGFDEGLAVGEDVDVFEFGGFVGNGGGDGGEGAAGDFSLREIVRVVAAHVAHADDTDPDRLHGGTVTSGRCNAQDHDAWREGGSYSARENNLTCGTPMEYSPTQWFIKDHGFARKRRGILDDDELTDLMTWMAMHPDAGRVIRGTGGLRKLRWAGSGRGKRGGARVIYFWWIADEKILLLDVYRKNEKEDLPADELAALKRKVIK